MIIAVVGAGGKTTHIHNMVDRYREENKKVFVTTSTHMYIESDTILLDDADAIITQLEQTGYAMAGIPVGEKIKALSDSVYRKVCEHADVVLIEADGAKRKPLKFPNDTEPVIYDNVDEIVIVWGIHALGKSLKDAVHRSELAAKCLHVSEETVLKPVHLQILLREGYLKPLKKQYPDKLITVYPTHDRSSYQREIASFIQADKELT